MTVGVCRSFRDEIIEFCSKMLRHFSNDNDFLDFYRLTLSNGYSTFDGLVRSSYLIVAFRTVKNGYACVYCSYSIILP